MNRKNRCGFTLIIAHYLAIVNCSSPIPREYTRAGGMLSQPIWAECEYLGDKGVTFWYACALTLPYSFPYDSCKYIPVGCIDPHEAYSAVTIEATIICCEE
jgi:hypothetical protein